MILNLLNAVIQLLYFLFIQHIFDKIVFGRLFFGIVFFTALFMLSVVFSARILSKILVDRFINKIHEMFPDKNLSHLFPSQNIFRKRILINDCFYLATSPETLLIIGKSGRFKYYFPLAYSDIDKLIVIEYKNKDESDILIRTKKVLNCPYKYTFATSTYTGLLANLLYQKKVNVEYDLQNRKIS